MKTRILSWTLAALGLALPALAQGDREIVIDESEYFTNHEFVVDEHGNYFVASVNHLAASGREIRLYRSIDGGETWTEWDRFSHPDPNVEYFDPSLAYGDGDFDQLYVAYAQHNDVDGVRTRLIGLLQSISTTDVPAWYGHVIESSTDLHWLSGPRVITDSAVYADYNVYVAYERGGFTGLDSHAMFTRSTNQGSSFEAPYVAIAPVPGGSVEELDLAFGNNHIVHLIGTDSTLGDAGCVYRRALNRAADVGSWLTTAVHEPRQVGRNVLHPSIVADPTSATVFTTYTRTTPASIDVIFRSSTTSGALWTARDDSPTFPGVYGRVAMDNSGTPAVSTQQFNLSLPVDGDLTNWESVEFHTFDAYVPGNPPAMDSDPTRGDAVVMVGATANLGEPSTLHVYAPFRSTPGHPSYQSTVFLGTNGPIVSHPAAVDVNGDGLVELAHVSGDGLFHLVELDGTIMPGWPVVIEDAVDLGAVAAGDVDGDGFVEFAVGTDTGQLFLFTHEGVLEPGFPVALGSEAVHVSLGTVTGSAPMDLVATTGFEVYVLGPDGAVAPGFPVLVPGTISHSAAIGDLDRDTGVEFVVGHGSEVSVLNRVGAIEWTAAFPAVVSGAPTMGEFDTSLPGLEVAVPLVNGELHVFDATGSPVSGFPFVDGTFSPATSAVFANNTGDENEELYFATRAGVVHGLQAGTVGDFGGFPAVTFGVFESMPVVAPVDDSVEDLVIGDGNGILHGLDDSAASLFGWPLPTDGTIRLSPIVGDVDSDGSSEVVFYTDDSFHVLDVDSAAPASLTGWSRYANDNQRTGCSVCHLDDIIAAPETGVAATGMSFASIGASPVRSSARFALELDDTAAVRVAVFAPNGRLVQEALRTALPAGRHDIVWDGRTDAGAEAAAGMYFVKMTARGEFGAREFSEKVLVVR